ncbi:MAG: MgtC/SapB family protein [Chloroflexi bacterium]|nr:MgtC/SapB family protein [Chloroflexota bacterium]
MPGNDLELMFRILLAAVLGAIVGLERERRRMPAGLRTFMLVSIGSALFMVVSNYDFDGSGTTRDPGRIAAQVVTGVGFLGAGMLFRTEASVRGLTTAAGMWAMAGVGLAAGAGMYTIAVFTTIIVTVVLWILRVIERGGNEHL